MTKRLERDRHLTIRVTHHLPPPDKYSWEIREHERRLPVEMGRQGYRTWEQAYRAGVLKDLDVRRSKKKPQKLSQEESPGLSPGQSSEVTDVAEATGTTSRAP